MKVNEKYKLPNRTGESALSEVICKVYGNLYKKLRRKRREMSELLHERMSRDVSNFCLRRQLRLQLVRLSLKLMLII